MEITMPMTLQQLCSNITQQSGELLPTGHAMASRLICPEYSKSIQEIKTYPLLSTNQLFALCWSFVGSNTLYATMFPSPKPFRYKHDFTPGEKTQYHTHDYIEFGFVVNGEFNQNILGRDVRFQKGDVYLIDRNCLHQDYLMPSRATVIFLGVTNSLLQELVDRTDGTRKIIAFLKSSILGQSDMQQYLHFTVNEGKPGCSEHMEECFNLLIRELLDYKTGSDYICKGLMLRIIHILSTSYSYSLSREQRTTMKEIILDEILDYIRQNCRTVTIQSLADTFHYQKDYFNRLIKSRTGMTYSDYVQLQRLERSAELITGTSMDISKIAEASGYHNKGFFYKLFKEKYGMTPHQYRKENTTGTAHK